MGDENFTRLDQGPVVVVVRAVVGLVEASDAHIPENLSALMDREHALNVLTPTFMAAFFVHQLDVDAVDGVAAVQLFDVADVGRVEAVTKPFEEGL